MKKEYISPKGVYEAASGTHAVRVGNTIYLGGKTGRDEQRNVVEGGFEAQAAKAFENMKLVLEAAGASLNDIVKLTIYFKNVEDSPKLRGIRDRFFTPPLPAMTGFQVASLGPGVLLEMDAIAVVED